MLGTLVALHVERKPNTVRNVYNSQEDCLWDYNETQCREDTTHSGGSHGRWYGPEYRDDETARRSGKASGKMTVRRGGFGFSGRGASG